MDNQLNNIPPQNPPVQQSPSMPPTPAPVKRRASLLVKVIVVFVLLIGITSAGAYGYLFYYPSLQNSAGQNQVQDNNQANETADWKTYANSEYGFEFKYPESWGDYNIGTAEKNAAVFFPETDVTIYYITYAQNPSDNPAAASLGFSSVKNFDDVVLSTDQKISAEKDKGTIEFETKEESVINGQRIIEYLSPQYTFALLEDDKGFMNVYLGKNGALKMSPQQFSVFVSTFKFTK